MDFVETAGELLVEIIIPWLFMVPGALIRWIISQINGSKKTYRHYYNAGGFLTGFLGFLTYVVLFIIIF